MVVSVGAVAVGAEPAGQAQGRPGTARDSRRDVMRGLLAAAGALVLAPVVAASRPTGRTDDPGRGGFDETYRGRRIRGVETPGRDLGAAQWQVTVDDRPLHLMRRADGTWLSMVDHYRSYATPLDATRAAVDELSPGQQLREKTHMGGHHHGVHP
ncbi:MULTISPECIES: tyrosinase family oxidase copper chaperone [unclassified Streptomyces]|uniref:tyrosinase cofactor n=1 Tax=unclassified Streptomyces TaxID=2593676 RepID=UPI0036E63E9B